MKPATIVITMQTLQDVLRSAPDALSVAIAGGPSFTRAALERAIHSVAGRLKAAGVKPGDVVCMAFENKIEFVVSFLAVTLARGVAAPLNAAYKKDEHAFYLEDSKAVLLILPVEGNPAAQQAAVERGVPIVTMAVQAQGAASPLVHIKRLGDNGAFPPPTGISPFEPPKPSDIALFLHTSGTTGRPKGVPLSHGNLMASVSNIIKTYDLVSTDVSYLVMPLFHVHGLMAGCLAPLAAGGTVVLPSAGKFSANDFWKDACEYRATFYTAVPTIHQILLARASKDYPASSPPPLRFIRSCSSALAPATLEKLEAVFKVPVLEAYAMTEASHQMCSNPLPEYGPHKPGTVGKAQGSVEVAILNLQNKIVPAGQIGEVCIRGPNVTAGYNNNPKANEEAFAGGWFHTGDQGFLDPEGYLTLTGRIKELINRGGEKISPLEVDAALLAHPAVAEAVSFGVPDDKYGEVVAAAVVLRPGVARDGVEESIKKHCAAKLAAFKVPIMIFVTDVLPKTATGKIQRRHMVAAFIKPSGGAQGGAAGGGAGTQGAPASHSSSSNVAGVGDGYEVVSRTLAALGVKRAFGVVGIPVTPLASSLQAAGIRFIGFRNEQAAGYAAAASGFLTGVPAVFLTVSGPGAIHGIAGASHATVNCMPLIMLSGSCEQNEIGKGAFQELDQVAALKQHCKWAGRPDKLSDFPHLLNEAFHQTQSGRPGAVYVDLPSNLLLERVTETLASPTVHVPVHVPALPASVAVAAQLLRGASRPLVVVGKGAAWARAEQQVQQLANRFGLPVLCTAMGRGLLPDTHPLSVNAARSTALHEADVALVVGARLNWQLHFGETPKWSSSVKFILLDVAPGDRDVEKATAVVKADAKEGLEALIKALGGASDNISSTKIRPWLQRLTTVTQKSASKVNSKVSSAPQHPLDYYGTLGTLRGVVQGLVPAPVVVSEGANTMDMARLLLPVAAPRTRLDAGTWGTMGVGLGYGIAAGVTAEPGQVVFAVEGDSAFGFSGMEVETMQRYKLPIIVIVMNNGGIYGGDRREQALISAASNGLGTVGFVTDPAPTSFVDTRYDLLMKAFGGEAHRVDNRSSLLAAINQAVKHAQEKRLPSLIDVVLDPMAGVESGNVHAFNAPKAKL